MLKMYRACVCVWRRSLDQLFFAPSSLSSFQPSSLFSLLFLPSLGVPAARCISLRASHSTRDQEAHRATAQAGTALHAGEVCYMLGPVTFLCQTLFSPVMGRLIQWRLLLCWVVPDLCKVGYMKCQSVWCKATNCRKV